MKVVEVLEKLNGEHNISSLSKEVQIPEKKFRNTLKELGAEFDNSTKKWSFGGDENLLEREITEFIDLSTTKSRRTTKKNTDVQTNEKKNVSVQVSENKNSSFTDEEMEVLKSIIKERKRDYELFSEYRVYDELSKVPTDEETERSAYTLSKTTTSRLKKYAKERRLPLQDLVELAIINLLDKYDKEK
ncbi:hypothetical protein BC30102_p123 (plasmid) [Bacillus cereus]|nr:hypothetical protein BC30102_p123 [Bacillus cereus]